MVDTSRKSGKKIIVLGSRIWKNCVGFWNVSKTYKMGTLKVLEEYFWFNVHVYVPQLGV